MSEPNPCRYCTPPKRNPHCHAKCPDYNKWSAKNRAEKDQIREAKKNEPSIARPWRKRNNEWDRGSNL